MMISRGGYITLTSITGVVRFVSSLSLTGYWFDKIGLLII